IIEFLALRGVEPLQDPANSNDAYARVRVRRDILPALERDRPGIVKRFHRAAERAAALQESLERIAATSLSGAGTTRSAVAAAHLKPGLALHLGYRTPGLRMRPLGGRGTRKLQDIFVDARVPREDRDVWPLVFAGDALAIVPGIAVSADMATPAGEPSLHVTVRGIPAKVESLNSLPGEPT